MLALALAIAPTPDLDPGPDADTDPERSPHPHPHPALTATTGFFQRPPLSLRTGSNHDDDGSAGDTESGGQPLDISVSFQYNLIKERIPEFYQKFGMAYEDSFARYAPRRTPSSPWPLHPKPKPCPYPYPYPYPEPEAEPEPEPETLPEP